MGRLILDILLEMRDESNLAGKKGNKKGKKKEEEKRKKFFYN